MSNFKEEYRVQIDESTATPAELQAELNRLRNLYEKKVADLEKTLVKFALKHSLNLELGEYGGGRTLIVQDKHWSGKDKGNWLYSSETC